MKHKEAAVIIKWAVLANFDTHKSKNDVKVTSLLI